MGSIASIGFKNTYHTLGFRLYNKGSPIFIKEVPSDVIFDQTFLQVVFQLHTLTYTMGPWRRFQWSGFHTNAFSKSSPNIKVIRYLLHKGRNSFTHASLVLQIWFL